MFTLATGLAYRYKIGASYEEMKLVRDAFRASLPEMGIGKGDVHNWMVVFSEALTNAIEHGARGDASQQINIHWTRVDKMLELTIMDPGLGFHTTDSTSLLRSHGYGLKLINYFCDTVEHFVNPSGGHVLHLTKRMENLSAPNLSNAGGASAFLQRLAGFYGNLGYPVSAGALLQPITDYLEERFGPAFKYELRLGQSHAEVGSYLPYYRGGLPCVGCESCPALQIASYSAREKSSCFPLRLGRRSLGALKVSGITLDNAASELLETAATCMALALENEYQQRIQKITQEALLALKVSANMQQRQRKVMACARDIPGVVHTFEDRAQTVAGDIIECAASPGGGTYMLIADVMGKGVAAAFLGGIFRGGWHLLSQTQSHPLLLMKELNRFLFDELNGQAMFVTAALAHLSADGQTFSFVNCGHTALYLQDKAGGISAIESSGPPLGLFAEPSFELLTRRVDTLERLYMPTDGLYSFGTTPENFSAKSLEDRLRTNASKSVAELWKALQLERQNALESQPDDQALLIWERKK